MYENEHDTWRVSTTSAIYLSNASSDSGLCLVSLSDRELSRFIASGRLSAKIDKVGATSSSFVTLLHPRSGSLEIRDLARRNLVD